jgi:hypothetical protein
MKVRKSLVVLAAFASALVVGVLSSAASGPARPPLLDLLLGHSENSVSCKAGFKPAVIGGKSKCLKTGQSCAKRYENAYRRYGFSCVNGHLRKKGPAPAPTAPTPQPTPPPLPTPPGNRVTTRACRLS